MRSNPPPMPGAARPSTPYVPHRTATTTAADGNGVGPRLSPSSAATAPITDFWLAWKLSHSFILRRSNDAPLDRIPPPYWPAPRRSPRYRRGYRSTDRQGSPRRRRGRAPGAHPLPYLRGLTSTMTAHNWIPGDYAVIRI